MGVPGRELFHIRPGSSAPVSRASLLEPGLRVLCELTEARLCLTVTKPASRKGGGNGFKRGGETKNRTGLKEMYRLYRRWLLCAVKTHSWVMTFLKLGWAEDGPLSWSLVHFMMLIAGP